MKRSLSLLLGALLLGAGAASGADFYADCFTAPSSTIFVSGFQRFAKLKNDDNALRTQYNPTAGAVGYTYNQGQWYAGASFSYEQGTRKYDWSGAASMRVKEYTPGFTLFGGWANQDGWYGKGSAFVGFSTLKGRDAYLLGVPYGDDGTEHNTQFGASLEFGKTFLLPSEFKLKPHVGFDYAHAQGESYLYNGGPGGLSYATDSQNFYEIPIGVGLSRTFSYGNWAVTPEVDLALINSLGHMDNMNYYPGFASRTADEWKVYGIGGDHFGGRIRAGINAKLSDRYSMGVDYTFEGRKDYQDHRISAMFGLSF